MQPEHFFIECLLDGKESLCSGPTVHALKPATPAHFFPPVSCRMMVSIFFFSVLPLLLFKASKTRLLAAQNPPVLTSKHSESSARAQECRQYDAVAHIATLQASRHGLRYCNRSRVSTLLIFKTVSPVCQNGCQFHPIRLFCQPGQDAKTRPAEQLEFVPPFFNIQLPASFRANGVEVHVT